MFYKNKNENNSCLICVDKHKQYVRKSIFLRKDFALI